MFLSGKLCTESRFLLMAQGGSTAANYAANGPAGKHRRLVTLRTATQDTAMWGNYLFRCCRGTDATWNREEIRGPPPRTCHKSWYSLRLLRLPSQWYLDISTTSCCCMFVRSKPRRKTVSSYCILTISRYANQDSFWDADISSQNLWAKSQSALSLQNSGMLACSDMWCLFVRWGNDYEFPRCRKAAIK